MIGSRRTIAREVAIEGIGLHLGQSCRLCFRPAAAGTGITFVRADRGGKRLRATADVAVLAERRTQLGEGDDALHTVEHVLAAVSGAFIDDLEIELDGPEPPIADGSAQHFLDALQTAGVASNGVRADYLTVRTSFVHRDGDSEYEVTPSDRLDLDVSIDFPHPLVGGQRGRWTLTPETFASELAPARTFGFQHELEMLRE